MTRSSNSTCSIQIFDSISFETRPYQEAGKIKREILSLCRIEEAHPAIKRWADYFIESADRLYGWVESRDVPAENNRAERELRPTVIARKVSFGSQAEEGTQTREVLMSLMQTLKKREPHPRRKFKEMLDKISLDSHLKVTQLLYETDSS